MYQPCSFFFFQERVGAVLLATVANYCDEYFYALRYFIYASLLLGFDSSNFVGCRVTAVGGQYQIGIYAVREIQCGEEITFDYNSVTEVLIYYLSSLI